MFKDTDVRVVKAPAPNHWRPIRVSRGEGERDRGRGALRWVFIVPISTTSFVILTISNDC